MKWKQGSESPKEDGIYVTRLIKPRLVSALEFVRAEGGWNTSYKTDMFEWLDESESPTTADLSALTGEPLESNTGYTTVNIPAEEGVEDYPTYEQAGGDKSWDKMSELERAYYNLRKAYNANTVLKNALKSSRAGALSVRQQGDDIEGLKRLLRMAGCPEILIENPSILNGKKPTSRDIEWCGKVVEKYELNIPQSPAFLPPGIAKQIWNMAITIANNECIRVSDDFNNDDQTEEAHAASECAKRIRGYIDNPIPEVARIIEGQNSHRDDVYSELKAMADKLGVSVDFSDKEYSGDKEAPMDAIGFVQHLASLVEGEKGKEESL
jgi:hypothetical protein